MAKGKKTGGRNFVKGQSGNLEGRPPLPADIKEAREINQIELERILNRFLQMSPKDLTSYKLNPNCTTLELLLSSILTQAVNKGDPQRLDFILNRLIGPIRSKMELSGPNGGPVIMSRPLRELPDEELLKLVPDAVQLLKGKE